MLRGRGARGSSAAMPGSCRHFGHHLLQGSPQLPHLHVCSRPAPGRGPWAAPRLVTVASLSPGTGRQNGPLAPRAGLPRTPWGFRSGPAPARAIPLPAPTQLGSRIRQNEHCQPNRADLQVAFAPTSTRAGRVFSEGARVSCFSNQGHSAASARPAAGP